MVGIHVFAHSKDRAPGRPPSLTHQIPDARASGFIFPIPAKSGFPISRIPGSRPNRDSRFPESRDPDQTGIPDSPNPGMIPTKPGFKSGKIPIFFAAARAVIKETCQRQARLVRFLVGVPGWEKRLIVQ